MVNPMATNQKPTGKLQVYGDYAVDSVLKSTNTIADANGLAPLRYQWLMDGKAIDIRCAGASLSDLGDAARSLRLGGVGFYQSEQFVHVDTGRIRYW